MKSIRRIRRRWCSSPRCSWWWRASRRGFPPLARCGWVPGRCCGSESVARQDRGDRDSRGSCSGVAEQLIRQEVRAACYTLGVKPTEAKDRNEPYRDPVVDAFKAGVDVTLLDRNLRLTPTQRLE